MLLHLVRHAMVTVRPDVEGRQWHLSPGGRAGAETLAGEPLWASVQVVYSSPEAKAFGTAQRIAARHGLPTRIGLDLGEVAGRTWAEEGYKEQVRRYFGGEDVGWEPAEAALARMRGCIEDIISSADGDVAAVSHGLVLTIYLRDLLSLDAEAAFELWTRMRFPDVCTVDVETRRVLRAFGAGAA